jgi:hypothetical protein
MEEKLSQCFESIGRGETFSQIESCQPFKEVYSLNDGSVLLTGIGMGLLIAFVALVVVSCFFGEN